MREDIHWWLKFAHEFNGVALIPDTDWSSPDHWVSSDSCLTGGGGFSEGKFFHWQYSKKLLVKALDINQLECLNVVMCLKLWGNKLARKKVDLLCDNTATVEAINSGS